MMSIRDSLVTMHCKDGFAMCRLATLEKHKVEFKARQSHDTVQTIKTPTLWQQRMLNV